MPNPGIFTKVNFILRYLADPCDAPLTFYAQTAAPAALQAIKTYYALDVGQIITAYVRPSSTVTRFRRGRKGGRGRKEARLRRTPWSISEMAEEHRQYQRAGRIHNPSPARAVGQIVNPLLKDPYDTVGKLLPGGAILAGRTVSSGVSFLWRVFNFAQPWLFWLFFIDLVVDFLYDWMSAIYYSEYCLAQSDTVLLASDAAYNWLAIVPSFPALARTIEKQRGNISWALDIATLGADTVIARYSCTITAGAGGCGAALRFVVGPSVSGPVLAERAVSLGPNESADIVLEHNVTGPGSLVVRWYDLAGSADITNADMFAQSYYP